MSNLFPELQDEILYQYIFGIGCEGHLEHLFSLYPHFRPHLKRLKVIYKKEFKHLFSVFSADIYDHFCLHKRPLENCAFFQDFYDVLDWDTVTIHMKTEELIEKYTNFINWQVLPKFYKMNDFFIRKYRKYLSMDLLCIYQKLSLEFLRKHRNELSWRLVEQHQRLGLQELSEFENYVDWYNISYYQTPNVFTLKVFRDNYFWDVLCDENNLLEILSSDDVLYFWDYLDWGFVSSHKLTEKQYKDFVYVLDLNVLLRDNLLTEELIEYYLSFRDFTKQHWLYVSEYNKLSDEFILKHYENLNFDAVIEFSGLSKTLIDTFAEEIPWTWLLYHTDITKWDLAFISKHSRFIDWKVFFFENVYLLEPKNTNFRTLFSSAFENEYEHAIKIHF